MTRDEEIRHDLARRWRELEGDKTEQDLGMTAQDIRDFLAIVKALRKKNRPITQGTRSPPSTQ